MKKIYFLIIFLLFFLPAKTQYNVYNAALISMGCSGVAINDFSASMNNQAAWGNLKDIHLGIGYDSKFMLKELSNRHISFALPLGTDRGTGGININQFGYSQFNITKAGIGYGRTLWPKFSVGFQFDAFHVATADENYGNTTAFTIEGGFQYKLNDKIGLGTHIFNPIQTKLDRNTGEKLPSSISLGMTYKPDEALLLAADIVKNQFQPASVRAGFCYNIAKPFCIRSGFSTAPFTVGGGVGIIFKKLTIDIATSYHQVLGFSPALTISYSFEKK